MAATLSDNEASLARAIVLGVDPGEIDLLDQLIRPERLWDRMQRGTSMGYGIETMLGVASPTVIAVSIWVGSIVGAEAGEVARERASKRLKKWTRKTLGEDVDPPVVVSTEAKTLYAAIVTYATKLGVDSKTGEAIASATIGALLGKIIEE